jgi:5-formyltetrahydrofolate cyclo-ligase
VNKSKLRKKIILLRKKKFKENFKIDSLELFKFLRDNKLKTKIVGGYYPCNHEIDDLEVLNLFNKNKIITSLPVIEKNNQMDFYEWSKDNVLKINKYGIVEPLSQKKVYPDILLVPLLAFDRQLNRLGYGGGFYDRYIEKIEIKKKVYKVGMSFSFQEIRKVPINNYDKRLDLIITERGLIF